MAYGHNDMSEADERCEDCGASGDEYALDKYGSGFNFAVLCEGCRDEREESRRLDEEERFAHECRENDDLIDGVGFSDPTGRSALRAETASNPRNLPCPTCRVPNRLTPLDRKRGYQCDACAERTERGGE